jgi:TolB-like protein
MEIIKPFPIEEINNQLHRILEYPAFRSSWVLTKFLEFIVSETIHERDQQIKEYSIAVNVLNRPPNFNPHDDAVVRIHAGRLRRALNEYYLTEGKNDSIIIEIPKGCYIPQFIAAGINTIIKPALYQPTVNPVVAVFPFKAIPQTPDINEFATMFGEQLSAELSRFHELSVIGYYSTEMKAKIAGNILEAAASIGADYIITGTLHYNDETVGIRINLLIAATGEVMMAKSFERKIPSRDFFKIQDEAIEIFMNAISSYYDMIFREMAIASPQKVFNNHGIWKGIFNYYKYQRYYSAENYTCAVTTLEESVKNFPDHPLSWAMLGELYLHGIGLGIKNVEDPLSKGYQCILQCLKMDAFCQHGWYALSWAHLLKKEKDACVSAARKCIQLNPNNSAMACSSAFMLFCAGHFDEGFPVMEKAVKQNPYYPWWINGGYSFYYLYKKEYSSALLWAEKMNSEETFWNPLLKSVSLSYLDKKKDAEKYLLKLIMLEPEIPKRLPAMLSTFILSEDLVTHIVHGLENAGLQQLTN